MVVLVMLEILGSGVGVYNLVKGLYNMYTDAGSLQQQYKEYQMYQNIQKGKFDPLTQSQYTCFEDNFVVL